MGTSFTLEASKPVSNETGRKNTPKQRSLFDKGDSSKSRSTSTRGRGDVESEETSVPLMGLPETTINVGDKGETCALQGERVPPLGTTTVMTPPTTTLMVASLMESLGKFTLQQKEK